MKLHISQILKPGAKLNARVLDPSKVEKLIKKTNAEQDKIIALTKVEHELLEKRITI